MRHFAIWLMAAISAISIETSTGYKPVFMIPGLSGNTRGMDYMARRIREAHPGTVIFQTNTYPRVRSNSPLWDQIKGDLGKEFQDFSKKYPQGFHLIGSSQGGLLGRGLIQTYADHNLVNLITVASPLSGSWGDVPSVPEFGMKLPESVAWIVLYNPPAQAYYSQANICKDPKHYDLYLKYNVFMPYIDNEIRSNMSETFKKGFTKCNKIVMVGGPDDGLIVPWQATHFSDIDADRKVVDFRDRRAYKDDWFGLRTMDEQGKLTICIKKGLRHGAFKNNDSVIDDCIIPHLD